MSGHLDVRCRARGLALCAPYQRTRWVRVLLGALWLLLICAVAVALTTASVRIGDANAAWKPVAAASLASVASGLFGAVTTVVSLELLRARRAEREQRSALLIRLRSPDPSAVSGAIEELRSKQLLQNGYLDGADLRGAALAGVDLRGMRAVGARLDGADLRRTVLYDADLRFASLRDSRISDATNLHLCRCGGADLAGLDAKLLRACGLPESR